jgi:hypothetical protein
MKKYAVVGAGMAGIVAARTLVQAGHRVTVFEQTQAVGGRMSSFQTVFGSFDYSAQYFTVRDPRFETALRQVPGTLELVRPWSANAVRVLDDQGRLVEAALPHREPHFVATPHMSSLIEHWAAPLAEAGGLNCNCPIGQIAGDARHPKKLQLHVRNSKQIWQGFDGVILALPHASATDLLRRSQGKQSSSLISKTIAPVEVAPCWSLMLAYPNASQPGLAYLGPQWNVARSTHHRIAWLARESSKPARNRIERWTVQASPAWSKEHLADSPDRVASKLLRAFSEITGIRAEPGYVQAHLWPSAQTIKPLGQSFVWDAKAGLGTCGDWHLGHRVEDAFVSGLELALSLA